MSLEDEIREVLNIEEAGSEEPEKDCAYVSIKFPRNGIPEISIHNAQILTIPKIQMIDRLILQEIRKQRAAALHALNQQKQLASEEA